MLPIGIVSISLFLFFCFFGGDKSNESGKTMTDPAHAPRCSGFEYVLIPANDGELPSVRKFSGSTDDEFRSEITAHFRQTLLNPEQQTQFANTLIAKAAAQRDKAAQKPPEDATTSGPVGQAGASEAKTEGVDVNEMVSQVTSETNFEIVPVTLPCRANRFTATSLYIDDAGRFKELPLNSRASRIAQRDVRGDAFLCSNHDDPALESWERVDCTMEVYKEMHSHPPNESTRHKQQRCYDVRRDGKRERHESDHSG